MTGVDIYDPQLFWSALGLPDGDMFFGPPEERPEPPTRTTEDEVWARSVRKILEDPRGPTRPALVGTLAMVKALRTAVASLPNFSAVTGIVERAIVQSVRTRRPIQFPPILMVSEPGIGKTFYCRAVASALATTCIPIAINGTSDRGQLGGLAPVWRGAKIGKIARGLLIESRTAAPLYLLDELDKPPALIAGENTLDILLSALEPENARAFVDEYLGVPINLTGALWLASANDMRSMPEPLLSRMLVIDVPKPTSAQARAVIAAIVAPILRENRLRSIEDDAVAAMLDLSARQVRQVLVVATALAVYERRRIIAGKDVHEALGITARRARAKIGFAL